ncbi:hypothetical protein [Paenibacillus sp. E222]|uniref:hypothetical protein n=1 Tax=Paenibacillus sp. E222 TaxID=2748863 RepID=UPI00211D135C|nr:hypothetical protein [Paenibacillus sp. E222]
MPKVLIDKLDVSQGDEIEFIENSQGEIILKKVRQLKIPENVRPEVLEGFFDVFDVEWLPSPNGTSICSRVHDQYCRGQALI